MSYTSSMETEGRVIEREKEEEEKGGKDSFQMERVLKSEKAIRAVDWKFRRIFFMTVRKNQHYSNKQESVIHIFSFLAN